MDSYGIFVSKIYVGVRDMDDPYDSKSLVQGTTQGLEYQSDPLVNEEIIFIRAMFATIGGGEGEKFPRVKDI
jgi:hypothetical protein